jgi:hypothetical protein
VCDQNQRSSRFVLSQGVLHQSFAFGVE